MTSEGRAGHNDQTMTHQPRNFTCACFLPTYGLPRLAFTNPFQFKHTLTVRHVCSCQFCIPSNGARATPGRAARPHARSSRYEYDRTTVATRREARMKGANAELAPKWCGTGSKYMCERRLERRTTWTHVHVVVVHVTVTWTWTPRVARGPGPIRWYTFDAFDLTFAILCP